jgi:serine-type D-Ala-D-Ala carboxypeptidase/endopeptidase (penicillin-binding protein 4)
VPARRRGARAVRPGWRDAGAWVFDADARRRPRLYASGAKGRKVPASNQKLFTTAAALGRCGARAHLKASLKRNGVKVEGRVGHGEARPDLLAQEPLARVRSPSMANLVTATNRPSNNFFAEMLLKRLAAEDDRVGTTERGARKAERFARSLAMGDDAADGSGLGRGNRASPRQVGSLLVAMLEQPAASAFRQSLPLAGREGTLASRMRGTAAEGRCRAKTGTLVGVSALSGYCRAGEGTVAFSIMMNGVDVYAARRAQDTMAAAIARYR